MTEVSLASDGNAEWYYLTDDAITKLGNDSFISQLYKEVVQDDDFLNNENLSVFFYEFIFLFTEYEKFSMKDGIFFIRRFMQQPSNKGNGGINRNLAIAFIQMLNLFPTSMKLEALLKSLSFIEKGVLARYLKTDHLKASKEIDNYQRKMATYMKESCKIKNYNLLHECSEGYAKLIVEVYEAVNSNDAYFMVDYLNKVILKLIGTFSLDPNRVLDVVLDIFANNILKNYRFCILVLKKSLWWPSTDSIHLPHNPDQLTKGGSDLAGQLLGLKLLNYQFLKSVCPETMKCLAVILIKEGFISFSSFFSYLTPDDSNIAKLQDQYKEYMDDKIFKASASALSLAAPLKDEEDEASSSKEKGGNGTANGSQQQQLQKAATDEKDDVLAPLGNKQNFKYDFLKYFLLFGLYDESVYMLTRYPVLAQIDDEISSLIHRLSHECIDDFYFSKYHPIKNSETLGALTTRAQLGFVKDHNLIDYEDAHCKNVEIFKLHRSHGDRNYIFFYHEWNQNLPKVQSLDDLFYFCNEFLSYSGSKLSHDTELLTKLVRIGTQDIKLHDSLKAKKEISEKQYEEQLDKWFQFFRKFIFPSIPLLGTNSPTVDIVFLLFQLFPIAKRYNLYGELEMKLRKKNLDITFEYDQATKKTKDGLKRLSKTNANIIMRNLSKISISNPLPFFQVITTQVESYDNLIDLIVQSARYFNAYAWDVLSYVLLTRLTSRRNFVQRDGLNDRLWLQNLSTFIGELSLNFANRFNTKILTEFIIRKLYEFDNITITLFKEILNDISGIASISNLSIKQIEQLNSGGSAAKLVFRTIFDKRYTALNTKASVRYLSNLASAGNDAKEADLYENASNISKISEIFVLLTNYYSKQIFLERSNENHSKILSNRNDELNGLIHSYTTMLNYFEIGPDFLSNNLLDIEKLLVDYKIDHEWVFELWRPTLSKRIVAEYESHPDSITAESPWPKTLSSIHRVLNKVETLESIDWKELSTGLFVSFWQLSLYDINYKPSNYLIKSKTRASIKALEQVINNPETTKKVAREKLVEKKKLESILNNVDKDQQAHEKHDKLIQKRIIVEKEHWFGNDGNATKQAEQFLEHCLLPRIIHCSFDAIYAARFLILLLEQGFKNIFYEILNILFSNVISTTIFTSTPLESENFGLFFCKLFEFLNGLREVKSFNVTILGLSDELNKERKDEGDDTAMQTGNGQEIGSEASGEQSEHIAALKDYKFKLFNWHKATVQELSNCLQNHDYMFRRNSITFLKNLLGVFPAVDDHCEEILLILENIYRLDEREDIRLASNALIGHMRSKKSHWIRVYDFYVMPEEEKAQYIEAKEKLVKEKRELEEQVEKEKKIKAEEEAKARDIDETIETEEKEAARKAEVEKQAEIEQQEENKKEAEAKMDIDSESREGADDDKKAEKEPETEKRSQPASRDASSTNATASNTNSKTVSPRSPARVSTASSVNREPRASHERNPKFVDVMSGARPSSSTPTKRGREDSVDSDETGASKKDPEGPQTKKRRGDTESSKASTPHEMVIAATSTEQIENLKKAIGSGNYSSIIKAIPSGYKKIAFDLKQLHSDLRSSYGKERISRRFTDLIEEMSKGTAINPAAQRDIIGKFDDFIFGLAASDGGKSSASGRGTTINELRNRSRGGRDFGKPRGGESSGTGSNASRGGGGRYPKKDLYRGDGGGYYNGSGGGGPGGSGGSGSFGGGVGGSGDRGDRGDRNSGGGRSNQLSRSGSYYSGGSSGGYKGKNKR